MAKPTSKQTVEPIADKTELINNIDSALSIAPDIDLESAIADELLNDIDWQKVRTALITKAKQKFISMLIGNGSDRPVVISPFPELHALPSGEGDEDKAA